METVTVLIVEQHACRIATSLSEEIALTLIAVASEDPASWEDIAACWPRYRTPAVPEFADGIPLESVASTVACDVVQQHAGWMAIDLVNKRMLTGGGIDPVGRDSAFAMEVDESGKQRRPLSIHLPPWWEVIEQTDPSVIDHDRERPIGVPSVRREVLFGGPLLEDLANRILNVVESEQWTSTVASKQTDSQYKFTVQVHRDWLMTPRGDLGGLMPRQLLHGGHEWIDRLVWAQRIRFEDGGEIVALPTDACNYENAPMGREEVAIYFDLCRELIGAGWDWCIKNELGPQSCAKRQPLASQLIAHLEDVKRRWLNNPYEGGSPPRFIIECSRRRVPRGVDIPIVGMAECESEQHEIDCDCPVCDMMAEGIFGTCFTGIDGHHLELDDEFAFSLHETLEQWQQQQDEFAEESARLDAKIAERESSDEAEPDPFASPWTGLVSEDSISGDSHGHVKLAFLIAEVVGMLQSAGAPKTNVEQLNARFTDFRQCEATEISAVARRLLEHLEALTGRYPELVSRLADLQSRIEEHIRCRAIDLDNQEL